MRPVDLFDGIVMNHRHPQHAGLSRGANCLDESLRVEIAESDADTGRVDGFRDFSGLAAIDLERDRRHAALAVAPAEDADIVAIAQVAQEPLADERFVRGDIIEGAGEGSAIAGAAAEPIEIVDDPGCTPGEFIVGVTWLELLRQLRLAVEIVVEPVELQQLLIFSVHHGEMRAIGLVEAEDIIIDIECHDIDETMRRISDGIDGDVGAMGMHARGDVRDRIDRAENVGRMGDGHEPVCAAS